MMFSPAYLLALVYEAQRSRLEKYGEGAWFDFTLAYVGGGPL